jgi:FSR family fosmidomycin resistance protein-like MFS transporter
LNKLPPYVAGFLSVCGSGAAVARSLQHWAHAIGHNSERRFRVSVTSEPATFTANEWRIIGITSAGHSLCHISELAFAAVIGAVMTEFQLAPDQAAALAVPGFVLYGVGAVPAGLWTDRRGSSEVLTAYFVLLAIAATAVCFARTSWQVGAALSLLGAAISLYHPAGLTMVSHGCQRRGRAMGINGVAGSFGVALGPALGLFLASRGQWRATYGLVAVLSGVCLAAATLLPVSLPKHEPARTASPRRGARGGAIATLALLFVAMLMGGINYRSLTTALPTFLSSLGSGGGRVFVILALGGVGQLLGGHLADRHSPARVYAFAILLTIPCALLMAHGGASTVMLAAAVLAVFMFTQQPLENIMIAEATPLQWRSTVYGLKFILAFGLASSGAYMTGWIWKVHGLPRVFDAFAAVAMVMFTFAALYAWKSRVSVNASMRLPTDARSSNRRRTV